MNPRSPPARPHIGFHSSLQMAAGWAEDDAWDSTSDSESPRQSTLQNSWVRRNAVPKTVPMRTPSNSSSSTLALSYTHIQAPNPGSYPPRGEATTSNSPKNGWTIVRTSRSKDSSDLRVDQGSGGRALEPEINVGDADVEGDMILGDLEPEVVGADIRAPPVPVMKSSRFNPCVNAIRGDVEEILAGIYFSLPPIF